MDEIVEDETRTLLAKAANGDQKATASLLENYRLRLKRMVQARMDNRLTQRFDPSDVVQDALLTASAKLPDYLRERPVPFYPWLRRLAWERLVDLQRQHIGTQRRSVSREQPPYGELSNESMDRLAISIAPRDMGPLSELVRQERLQRVRQALSQLGEQDQEVLVLRYLEGLSLEVVAEVMGTSVAAIKMRHMRAIRRLRDLLPSD
jgi:RNA polymerase sigma-70 factor (ECF subfamily)